MNQDNNFNTQGNNGIPNNQPLNNQSNGVNQQPINQQPQPTPSYQQPIMQEQTPYPTNTFESNNANNQSFNIKPTKKINLGLIIGIVVAVAVVGVGIVFGGKILSNGNSGTNGGSDISGSSNNNSIISKKDYSIEKLKNDFSEVYITNYVDTQLGFYFEYPVVVDWNDYKNSSSGFRDSNVYAGKEDKESNISSVFGGGSIRVLNLRTQDGYSSEQSFEEISKIIQTRHYGSSTTLKFIKEFENNNIKWAKYTIKFENGNFDYIYIGKQNTTLLGIVLKNSANVRKLSDISEDLSKKVANNEESICDSIISSLKFTDDMQYLMNLKEASILYYNTIYEIESVLIYDSNGNEMVSKAVISGLSGIYGIGYQKTNDITIDNAITKLTSANYPHRILDTQEYTYTIKNQGNIINLNEKNVGEIKIKYYELDAKSPKYTSSSTILAYVFVTDNYYGLIINRGNANYRNKVDLDYAMKNISFSSNNLRPWDVEDYAK